MAWVFDTHPADSRVVGPVKVAGCVVARYGTGGGNTPMVVDILCRASTQSGAESMMNTATTITTDKDRTIIAHKNEAVALQGNIIDRDAGMNGAGVGEDVSFTLNTVDRHGVAYDTGCLTPGEAQEQRCYSADAPAPTLQSRECGGGQGKSFVQKAGENVQPKYIVRRLMPVECGRLQGFPVRLRDSCFFRDKSGYPEIQDNQTLSVAGKRAGLDGNRSGLFRQAIRIILEMLQATGWKYPRFVIWENVPGALSSNGGKDFETVLNELLRLTGTDQFVRQRGKWGGLRRVRSCGLPTCQCAILGSAPTQTQSIRLLRYWWTIRRPDTF